MRRRSLLKLGVASLASFAVAAVGPALAPVGGLALAGASPAPSPSAATPAATSLPGVIAYVSDSNFYGTNDTETLATLLPDGSGRRVLISSTSDSIGLVSLSPSGRRLAYFSGTGTSAAVKVMTTSTKHATSVFTIRGSGAFIDGIAWSASGTNLIVGTNEKPGTSQTKKEAALWSLPIGGGSAVRLTPYKDAGSPAVAADGDLVYVVSTTFSSSSSLHKSELWIAGAAATQPRQLLASSHFVDSPAVAPDGQTVVVAVVDNDTTSNLESVTVTNATTSTLTKEVQGRSDVQPSWSPDGSHLVFLSSRAGRYASSKSEELLDAYEMTASGTEITKIVGYHDSSESVGSIDWGL